jgi:hypothetical protein
MLKIQPTLSIRQLLFTALALVTTVGFLSLPDISGAQSRPGNYGEAIRLFRALYPELTNRDIQLDLSSVARLDSDDFPRVFELAISGVKPLAPAQDQSSQADKFGHLSVRFQYDARDHMVFSLFSSGEYVLGDKQEKINQLVDAHQDWTETEMTEALLSLDAMFGPKENAAVTARLPVDRLEPLVGTIQISSVDFAFRGNSKEPYFAIMNWTIHFRASTGKHHDEYVVSIEPFGGKIVSLSRPRIS